MGGTPRVVVIEPWIRTRFDSYEPILPGLISQGAASASEIRIQRSGMLVLGMSVAACGVRLPNLDERTRHRASVTVENASADDDPLAQRFARVLHRQVVVFLPYLFMPVDRSGNLRQRVRQKNQRLQRRALLSCQVRLVKRRRLAALGQPTIRL